MKELYYCAVKSIAENANTKCIEVSLNFVDVNFVHKLTNMNY